MKNIQNEKMNDENVQYEIGWRLMLSAASSSSFASIPDSAYTYNVFTNSLYSSNQHI